MKKRKAEFMNYPITWRPGLFSYLSNWHNVILYMFPKTIVQLCAEKNLWSLASIHCFGIANYCWLLVLKLNSAGMKQGLRRPGFLFRFCLLEPLRTWSEAGGRPASWAWEQALLRRPVLGLKLCCSCLGILHDFWTRHLVNYVAGPEENNHLLSVYLYLPLNLILPAFIVLKSNISLFLK